MCSLSAVARIGAGVMTFGTSEIAIYAGEKALDAINPPAEMVNSKGDKLSDTDKADLDRQNSSVRAAMVLSWLTGGGPPKPVSPGKTYGESEKMAGVIARGAAGSGMSGLFGAGLVVGDLTPKEVPLGAEEPYKAGPIPRGVPSLPALPDIDGPTSNGGNTGQPGTGPVGPTQNVPNRGPGDVYPGMR